MRYFLLSILILGGCNTPKDVVLEAVDFHVGVTTNGGSEVKEVDTLRELERYYFIFFTSFNNDASGQVELRRDSLKQIVLLLDGADVTKYLRVGTPMLTFGENLNIGNGYGSVRDFIDVYNYHFSNQIDVYTADLGVGGISFSFKLPPGIKPGPRKMRLDFIFLSKAIISHEKTFYVL